MKLIITLLLLIILFTNCTNKKEKSKTASKAIKESDFHFKESDMKTVDLSTISPFVTVIMKVPKTAKVIKNGNDMIDILLDKNYVIIVDYSEFREDFKLKECIENRKILYLNEKAPSFKGIITKEDANGFVYKEQTRTEENGIKYEPEYHFSYTFTNGKEMYNVNDQRPLDNFDLPGSFYSESNANKLYDWVKSSMKIKEIIE